MRRGETGTTVCYADRFTPKDEAERARDEDREARQLAFLKRFTVFNAAQCDGLPEDVAIVSPPPPPGLIEPQVEALIRATSIDFRIGGDRVFYVPAHDYVQVPPPQAYFEPINWHRTALHELGHASGHASRLGRDLTLDQVERLDALLRIGGTPTRSPLAWIRDWPEAPGAGNLKAIVERLDHVRGLGIEAGRARRIHASRYAVIAREAAIMTAQHLTRLEGRRRLATLVAFAIEMEVALTDAAILMVEKG